jgi:hypothetical protein
MKLYKNTLKCFVLPLPIIMLLSTKKFLPHHSQVPQSPVNGKFLCTIFQRKQTTHKMYPAIISVILSGCILTILFYKITAVNKKRLGSQRADRNALLRREMARLAIIRKAKFKAWREADEAAYRASVLSPEEKAHPMFSSEEFEALKKYVLSGE